MAYDKSSLPTVGQLKKTAEKSKNKIDLLKLSQEVLEARMDTQVTASTETDADYAAEVVDARIDAWANENTSLGTGIREGQIRQTLLLKEVKESHQAQIDDLAEARLENLVTGIEAHEALREGLSKEEEYRIDGDENLQNQMDSLSGAILNILFQISEIREIIRK